MLETHETVHLIVYSSKVFDINDLSEAVTTSREWD